MPGISVSEGQEVGLWDWDLGMAPWWTPSLCCLENINPAPVRRLIPGWGAETVIPRVSIRQALRVSLEIPARPSPTLLKRHCNPCTVKYLSVTSVIATELSNRQGNDTPRTETECQRISDTNTTIDSCCWLCLQALTHSVLKF